MRAASDNPSSFNNTFDNEYIASTDAANANVLKPTATAFVRHSSCALPSGTRTLTTRNARLAICLSA